MALAAAARRGVKILAVSGPKGENTWDTHRRHMIETMETVRQAAAAMRANVISLLSQIPSIDEPFVAMGFHKRKTPSEQFPPEAVRNFLLELQKYVVAHVRTELFHPRNKVLNRVQLYKMRKRNAMNGPSFRNQEPFRPYRKNCRENRGAFKRAGDTRSWSSSRGKHRGRY
ncbi:unnamed protein product [Nippostrongylus brasiliensis]|uniref:Mediator of RNA polymerase II transcription subunit 25 n=1 Tax=Nippostrongylus brasiliensis TaxID=27835 RepID=A0A0N4XSB6_NIPBR|nr:hypothetical protein Q1695_012901 [Nippostrongylus brasiliensis]VDL69005.1 unnamed protein product [Nippostrongylus brasiliensis]